MKHRLFRCRNLPYTIHQISRILQENYSQALFDVKRAFSTIHVAFDVEPCGTSVTAVSGFTHSKNIYTHVPSWFKLGWTPRNAVPTSVSTTFSLPEKPKLLNLHSRQPTRMNMVPEAPEQRVHLKRFSCMMSGLFLTRSSKLRIKISRLKSVCGKTGFPKPRIWHTQFSPEAFTKAGVVIACTQLCMPSRMKESFRCVASACIDDLPGFSQPLE